MIFIGLTLFKIRSLYICHSFLRVFTPESLSLNNCLTLRSSIIGRELSRHNSLLDWFLAQSGSIKGFKNAIFSGFTTKEFARIIEKMIAAANNKRVISSLFVLKGTNIK